jgi:prolyl-tRNA editing enzyme YbaK/EbsC (Cys-tRNA(Pro) deacylase)
LDGYGEDESSFGKQIIKPDAETLRRVTGFSMGGVPPMRNSIRFGIIADEDLLNYPLVYAATGTAHAVFAVSPRDLVRITEPEVVNIKEG